MAREDYNARIISSSRELTAKEKIMLKDFNDCIGLDMVVTTDKSLTIKVDLMVQVAVHNERANGDKDYTTTVLVADDGTKYSTSSKSLSDAIEDINDEIAEAEDTELADNLMIKIFKKPSKNYAGKYFLTAVLV